MASLFQAASHMQAFNTRSSGGCPWVFEVNSKIKQIFGSLSNFAQATTIKPTTVTLNIKIWNNFGYRRGKSDCQNLNNSNANCVKVKLLTYYNCFLFRYLVEAMEKCYLSRFVNSDKLDQYSKETTPLNQILGGYLRSTVRCLACHHLSTTYQHFQVSSSFKFWSFLNIFN